MLTNCHYVEVHSGNDSQETSVDVVSDGDGSCAPIFHIGMIKSQGIVGSSYVEIGESKVLCSVTSPKCGAKSFTDYNKGNIECEVSYSPLLNQENEGNIDAYAKAVKFACSSAIRLNSYPKSIISINIMILSSNAVNDLSACINSSTLALADGGYELNDLVTSCSLSYRMTATMAQKYRINSLLPAGVDDNVFTISYLLSFDTIVHLESSGRFPLPVLSEVLEVAKVSCSATKQLMKDCIQKKICQLFT